MISPSICFLATGITLLLAFLLARQKARQTEQLELALGAASAASAKPKRSRAGQTILKPEGFSADRTLALFLRSQAWARSLRQLLDASGNETLPLDRFLLVLAPVALSLVALLSALKGPVVAVIGAGIALYIYLASLQLKKAKREKLFGEQFCDGVRLLLAQLRAGRNLRQAMETVGKESPAPLGAQFCTTCNDWQAGIALEDALEMMVRRNNNQDLPLLVSALRVAHKAGGGHLIQILENLIHIVQERKSLFGKVRAVTASQRMSAAVIGGAPFLLGGLLYLISPGYLNPLLETATGNRLLALAVALQVIGYFVIRKILAVKF
jgi:tight adherence protein B